MKVDQIAFVTEDLADSARLLGERFGLSGWAVWTYDGALLSRRDGEWAMRVAVAGSSPQVELVQPLAGPSVFDATGPGLAFHHVGWFVDSFAAARDTLEARGFRLRQAGGGHGLDGDGSFGYFEADLGFYVEVIEPPRRRPEPEATIG